jgi:electron transport complex protein RnfC
VLDIRVVPLPEGGRAEAVVVALEGTFDRLGRREERYLWKSMARRDVLGAIRDRGVVDTEPPGIPLYDLLSGTRDIGLLILNAVESEPYLRAEACILARREAEVAEGLAIIRKVVSPKRTVVAAEALPGGAGGAESLAAAIERGPGQDGGWKAESVALEPRYPQDLPGQLLEAIEGSRSAPSGEVLIVRPSTALAAYEAVVLAKPMIERYVTVDGGALRESAVLKARIGTPIRDLIAECGGFSRPPARLVLCGPFRGYAVHDLDVPTTKTTSAILALSEREIGSMRRSPCIRCGSCSESCPERLDPEMLYRLAERGRMEEARALGLGSCTLCGSCGYSCPSRVPLVAAFASRLREREASI